MMARKLNKNMEMVRLRKMSSLERKKRKDGKCSRHD